MTEIRGAGQFWLVTWEGQIPDMSRNVSLSRGMANAKAL